MKNFYRVWQKSIAEVPNDEEILSAARDLYPVLFNEALSRGESWKIEPNPICCLNEFVPLPKNREKGKGFTDYLNKAFSEKTGLSWDPGNYVLVLIPLQILGSRKFVVFKK